jgi:hypothetical protein
MFTYILHINANKKWWVSTMKFIALCGQLCVKTWQLSHKKRPSDEEFWHEDDKGINIFKIIKHNL